MSNRGPFHDHTSDIAIPQPLSRLSHHPSDSTSPSAIETPPRRLARDLTFEEVSAIAGPQADRVYRDLYRTDSPHDRAQAWASKAGLDLRALREVRRQRGARSSKILFSLRDGFAVETVVLRRHDGFTVCVSSQVGCAFGCLFCASGQAGIGRNLSSGEMVEQVLRCGVRANRIVFMGMGEPLSNYAHVLRAIRTLRDRRGLDFPTSGMTLSTVGIPKALARLREEHLALNLVISLHATTQQQRALLLPGTTAHPIEQVVAASLSYATRHNRVVTFSYLLLSGINDSRSDLARLCAMFEGRPARLNLMRWNPVQGIRLPGTNEAALAHFRRILESAEIPTTVRDTQGRDITAACGQLWLRDANGGVLKRAPLGHIGRAFRPASSMTRD